MMFIDKMIIYEHTNRLLHADVGYNLIYYSKFSYLLS